MRTNVILKTPLTPGTCEWCGKPCELEDVACSLSCEALLNREEVVQGAMVLRVLKRWRKHRGRRGGPGEGALTEATELVDRFLRQDRVRREKFAENRRAAEAQAAAPKPKKGATRAETAAPMISPPEDQPPS